MKHLTIAIASLLVSTTVQADTFSDFAASMVAFSCVDNGGGKNDILLAEIGGELRMLNPKPPANSANIKRTSRGYQYEHRDQERYLSYLNNKWLLYFADETGPFTAQCIRFDSEQITAIALAVFEITGELASEDRLRQSNLIGEYKALDAANQKQLQELMSKLNTALARAAVAVRKQRLLEEAERKRLQFKAPNGEVDEALAITRVLVNYQSETVRRVREVLGTLKGVRIERDRIVFSARILFRPGEAELSFDGLTTIARVSAILRPVVADIPPEIDWVIRVDGHTDNRPLNGHPKYAGNWELSQRRALSVVMRMTEFLGVQPSWFSANGFGEYQPVNTADTPDAWAQNARIELKLTEK